MATQITNLGGGAAGAGGGSGDGGGSESAYSSSSSDLELLDGLSDEVLEENAGAGAGDGGEGGGDGAGEGEGGAGGEGAGAGEGAEGAAPEWLEAAPAELKSLLAANNVSAAAKEFLKKTFGEYLGLKESLSGDPEVAAELTDLFPGGIEDIRAAHESAQTFQREMTQFESGDPAQQTEMLSGLLQQNADAFVSMVPVGLDLLKQTLRDDWTSIASSLSREYLDTITDGKFGTFFDGLVELAGKYNGLQESNPDEAAKFAAKLGGAALTMAEWWSGAKPKLGYDKAAGDRGAAGAPGAAGGRNVATSRSGASAGEDPHFEIALQKAELFEANLSVKHDSAINPLIKGALASAVKDRGITLSARWQNRIEAAVAKAITRNLKADRAFQAKLTREYHRGDSKRPQNWDRSERVAASLINAAKARAQKLIPILVKRALDDVGSIAPKKGASGAGGPASGVRSGSRTATGAPGALSDADLKNPEISDGALLSRLTGV